MQLVVGLGFPTLIFFYIDQIPSVITHEYDVISYSRKIVAHIWNPRPPQDTQDINTCDM